MAGQFQGREPTWKPFYVPYHLPIHGTAWLWAIFDHPSHISMAGGGQKWLIFRSKSGRNGRLVPGQGTNLETVLCAISPPNTWDSMITWNSMMLDHFCVLSVLLTVIFGAILHFFIQGMAILHSWDGYFTFWERNHPGHYTQELGTDCISTAISLIISSLHQ